jgi:hypothetical protein
VGALHPFHSCSEPFELCLDHRYGGHGVVNVLSRGRKSLVNVYNYLDELPCGKCLRY